MSWGRLTPPPTTYTAPTVDTQTSPAPTQRPTYTRKPTATSKPTNTPTSPPKFTNTPTSKSEVKGVSTSEVTPTPQVLSSADSNDGNGSLATAGIVGVSGLGYYLFRKYKG